MAEYTREAFGIRDRDGRYVEFKDAEVRAKLNELIATANTSLSTANAAANTAEEAASEATNASEYMRTEVAAMREITSQAASDAAAAVTSSAAAQAAAEQARDENAQTVGEATETAIAEAQAAANAAVTSAETHAQAAAASAQTAATSESNAAASASAAEASAQAAANSAQDAEDSVETIRTIKTETETARDQAANSAADAGDSASAASGSAQNAQTSATSASGSATAASQSASAAQVSASNAATSAQSAGTSETNAAASDASATAALTEIRQIQQSIPADYTTLSNDVTELKNDLYQIAEVPVVLSEMTKGHINGTTGEFEGGNYQIRTAEIEYVTDEIVLDMTAPEGYAIAIFVYDQNGGFIEKHGMQNSAAASATHRVSCTIPNTYGYAFAIGRFPGNAGDFVTDAFVSQIVRIVKTAVFETKTGAAAIEAKVDALIDEPNYIDRSMGPIGTIAHKFTSIPMLPAITIVGTAILGAFPSDTGNPYGTLVLYQYTGDIDPDAEPTIKTIRHTWGHLNTIDYSRFNDCLIFGNGGKGSYNGGSSSSAGDGAIYIIPNFSQWISSAVEGTTYSLSDAGAIEIACPHSNPEFAADSKFNVIWGENNSLFGGVKQNVCYLVTGDYGVKHHIRKIRRLLLGTESNQFEFGTMHTVESGFNGTFKILDEYEVKGVTDAVDYINDMCMVDNKIRACIGENPERVWDITLDDSLGYAWYTERKQNSYNAAGELVTRWVTGSAVYDDYWITSISNSGGTVAYGSGRMVIKNES